MSPSSNLNDWVEYKRLVLAELERLNECIDKLQDNYVETATHIHECRSDKKEVIAAITKLKKRIDDLHRPISPTGVPVGVPVGVPEARWKFFAAIATVIGSAIVSIISLITAMLK